MDFHCVHSLEYVLYFYYKAESKHERMCYHAHSEATVYY